MNGRKPFGTDVFQPGAIEKRKIVLCQWKDSPSVLRMIRKGDTVTLEITGTPKMVVTIPAKDFFDDVDELK